MNMNKGLIVNVLRHATAGDCSNGGISSRCHLLTMVGEGVPEIFDVIEIRPAIVLVRGEYGFYFRPFEDIKDGNVGYMFGGNFVTSSDSRFCTFIQRAVGGVNYSPTVWAIPLYDRQETPEQHDILSR
jgi:hypothetical protein